MLSTKPSEKIITSLSVLQGAEHLGVATATLERITEANDAFLQMLGFTRAEMEAGLIDWQAMTPPQYRALDEHGLEQVRQFGTCVPFEKEFVLRDGKRLPILVGAVRLQPEPLEWACWVVNLSSQKSAIEAQQQARELELLLKAEIEGAQRIHSMSSRLLNRSSSLTDVLEEILDCAIEIADADFGNIQLLDGSTLRIVVQRGLSETFLDFFNEVSHETTAACSEVMKSCSRVVVENVATSALFAGTPAREILLGSGIQALESTPLLSASGELYGVISTHFRRTRDSSERTSRYLDLLAVRAGQVIQQVQYRQAERQNERLTASAELASRLAHEINNPLQALTNTNTLLSTHSGVDDEAQKLVRIAEQELNKLASTVRELLAVDFKHNGRSAPELLKLMDQMQTELSHKRTATNKSGA